MWRAVNDGAGVARYFVIWESPEQKTRYLEGAGGRLIRFRSFEAAQRRADQLNNTRPIPGGGSSAGRSPRTSA